MGVGESTFVTAVETKEKQKQKSSLNSQLYLFLNTV